MNRRQWRKIEFEDRLDDWGKRALSCLRKVNPEIARAWYRLSVRTDEHEELCECLLCDETDSLMLQIWPPDLLLAIEERKEEKKGTGDGIGE